jgi:quercetin dioxygenase-like cupin family protein
MMSKGNFGKWAELPQTDMTPKIHRRLVSGEKVMSVYFTLDKGAIIAEHKHPHEQITHIISGKIEFNVNGEKKVMGSGEFVYIPGDVPHSAVILEDTINIEVFGPPREDFLSNTPPAYMKQQ